MAKAVWNPMFEEGALDDRGNRVTWAPEKDITSHELALCLVPLIVSARDCAGAARMAQDTLPFEAARHFKVTKE